MVDCSPWSARSAIIKGMASSLETGRAAVARCSGSRAAARSSSTAAPPAQRSRRDMEASLRYAGRMVPQSTAAVLLLAALSAGCGPSARTAPARSGAASDPRAVVAEVDGVAITAEELDRHAAAQLQQVRDQEYEIRKNALDDLVTRRLLQKEAASRGISEDELLRVEVQDKV